MFGFRTARHQRPLGSYTHQIRHIMKYTTKRDLLLRELVGIIDQSELCRKKIEEKARQSSNTWYTQKCVQLQKIFGDMREKIQNHSAEKPVTIVEISHFKHALASELDKPYRHFNEIGFYCDDVISEDQSFFAQLIDKLIYAMRAILRCFDWFFSSAESKRQSCDYPKSYNEGGETGFALRLTGHSQFFPRPIHCLRDAQYALDNITDRLEDAYSRIATELFLASIRR